MKTYSNNGGDITAETVDLDGENVLVITIEGSKISEWYLQALDRVIIHVDGEKQDPKLL